MKHNTISRRRRHLMIAGLAGVAAPVTLYAAQGSLEPRFPVITDLSETAGVSTEGMVVSGRILGAAGKPLFDAMVEVWQSGSGGNRASAKTDADGRFFTTIAPADYSGSPRDIQYRVSHQGNETGVTKLDFARASGDQIAHLQRDDAGAWRATFGTTVA